MEAKPLHNRGRIPITGPQALNCICDDIFHDFLASLQEDERYMRPVDHIDEDLPNEDWGYIYTVMGEILAKSMHNRLLAVCEAHYPEYLFEITSYLFEES